MPAVVHSRALWYAAVVTGLPLFRRASQRPLNAAGMHPQVVVLAEPVGQLRRRPGGRLRQEQRHNVAESTCAPAAAPSAAGNNPRSPARSQAARAV